MKKLQISRTANVGQDRAAQLQGLHQWMYYNLHFRCLLESLFLQSKEKGGDELLSLRSDRENICLYGRVILPKVYLKNTSLRNGMF